MPNITDKIRRLNKLPLLSKATDRDKVHQCECGSFAFFAWGVKLLSRDSYGFSPRNQNYAGTSELMICAKCHKPVMIEGGELYDASEFVTAADVERIIEYSQIRNQRVPIRAMDP